VRGSIEYLYTHNVVNQSRTPPASLPLCSGLSTERRQMLMVPKAQYTVSCWNADPEAFVVMLPGPNS
jgi:hypothetical protein